MNKKLSIVIMAHPSRKEWAEDLSKQLNDCPVVYDKISNVWDTCRRSWLAIDKDAEYGLVLQDDAILCDSFIERTEKILNEDLVYALYAGALLKTRIMAAVRRKQDYTLTTTIFNEVAICMRTEHIDAMVKFCDDRDSQTDQDITKWARQNRKRIYYPIPSLVDHRASDSIYRNMYNKPEPNKHRHAVLFKKEYEK